MSSFPSYRSVPYPTRTFKWIERRMMFSTFARLAKFAQLDQYRYVGFGTPFFTDFVLAHRMLGIHKMLNIEMHEDDEERFVFNRPYKNIELEFGLSHNLLPDIDWSDRAIVWLDFDSRLEEVMIRDLETFIRHAKSGSALAITVGAKPYHKVHGLKPNPEGLETMQTGMNSDLKEHTRRVRLPDVKDWGTAAFYHKVLANKARDFTISRNVGEQDADKVAMRQVFNFHYKDGSEMLTVGWILVQERDNASFEACKFDDLTFVRSGEQPFRIEVPPLTAGEIRAINAQLPGEPIIEFLDEEEVAAYASVYRYYPQFLLAE
jgi:hypothetical protein